MYREFAGKVAIVTGGAKGLGKAISHLFAAKGARVAICDIDEAAGREAERNPATSGILFCRADVSSEADVERVVSETVRAFGRIDFLVNNAGLSQRRAPLTELEEADYERLMGVNLKGTWLFMKHSIPRMLETGGGAIVNISSAMGLVAQRDVALYAASKHAVVGLTKAAAIEFGRRNIRVNAICPGRHDTPMVAGWKDRSISEAEWQQQIERNHPATGRMGRAEEIASAAAFLCSTGGSNIHGVALPVDGGWTAQ